MIGIQCKESHLWEVLILSSFSTKALDFEVMRNVDIRTVDPAGLVDIRDTTVDPNKPLQERMADFILLWRIYIAKIMAETVLTLLFW